MQKFKPYMVVALTSILCSISTIVFSHPGSEPHTQIPKNRQPAKMPFWAYQSGYCCMVYDIKEDGTTTNIYAQYCTENYLRINSVKAVKKWAYEKITKDGRSVKTKRFETRTSFIISDTDGTILYGKNGFPRKLKKRGKDSFYCGAALIS
ncbi:MAG: hypothetical protein COA43_02135 [Robiginitomaculum sp.]|nr:MAG: hypothetical protein COA43_02135 [Robiginitomaculum sp.]